jgi:hypothetical protein
MQQGKNDCDRLDWACALLDNGGDNATPLSVIPI